MGKKNKNTGTGIDRLNESEKRYGQLEKEGVARQRHGERETEFQEESEGRRRDLSIHGEKPARDKSDKSHVFPNEGSGKKPSPR